MNNKQLQELYNIDKTEKDFFKRGNKNNLLSGNLKLSPIMPFEIKANDDDFLMLKNATTANYKKKTKQFYERVYEFHINEVKKNIAGSIERYDEFEEQIRQVMKDYHENFKNKSLTISQISEAKLNSNNYKDILLKSTDGASKIKEIENLLKNINNSKKLAEQISEDLKNIEKNKEIITKSLSLFEEIDTKNNEICKKSVKALGEDYRTITNALDFINNHITSINEQEKKIDTITECLQSTGIQMSTAKTNKEKEQILRENQIWSTIRLLTTNTDALGGKIGELGFALHEIEGVCFAEAAGTNTVSKNSNSTTVSKNDAFIYLNLIKEAEKTSEDLEKIKIGISLKAHPSRAALNNTKKTVQISLVSSSVQELLKDSFHNNNMQWDENVQIQTLNTLLSSKYNLKLKNLIAYSHFVQAVSGFKDDSVDFMVDSHLGYELVPDFIKTILEKNVKPFVPSGGTIKSVRQRIINTIKSDENATADSVKIPLTIKTRKISF